MRKMLIPKIFTTLRGYTPAQFSSDLLAGLVVGVVAIPLAIAFGIASGVTPDKGLITAVVAGFLVSLLGGSRVSIGGPTGAFIVIVYGIVQQYGVDGLIIATMMAGVILFAMGLARMGSVIEFVPHSVVVGFTSGIAVIIFSSQIKDLFGLQTGVIPGDFMGKWRTYAESAATLNPAAFCLAAGTVLILAVWPRVSRRVPGSIIALVLFSVAAIWLKLPVETIGSRFGDLPRSLPMPRLPQVDLKTVQMLIRPAFTIAMLGAIESLLCAVVADGMIGGRHRPNMELVAQGAANIASGMFGGIPATGAIARTVTNIKNGGRTPVAGIVHALTVLAVLFFFGNLAKHIPLACLAGILTMVAYHMSEWRSFREICITSRGGLAVVCTTFFITVFFDLTLAIEIGMVMSMFIFMRRMAEVTRIRLVKEGAGEDPVRAAADAQLHVPDGVEVYEISGPFFFGVAHKFDEATRIVAKKPRVRILCLRDVPFVDGTGIRSLKSFYERSKHDGIHLIVAGLHVQPLNEIVKADLFELFGEDNLVAGLGDAIKRAEEVLNSKA